MVESHFNLSMKTRRNTLIKKEPLKTILVMFCYHRPVRLAYQPPANSTFLSEQTSHQQPVRTSQQYSSLRTNQHQPSATSQPNRLHVCVHPTLGNNQKNASNFLNSRVGLELKTTWGTSILRKQNNAITFI
jgi:hypothetical protein